MTNTVWTSTLHFCVGFQHCGTVSFMQHAACTCEHAALLLETDWHAVHVSSLSSVQMCVQMNVCVLLLLNGENGAFVPAAAQPLSHVSAKWWRRFVHVSNGSHLWLFLKTLCKCTEYIVNVYFYFNSDSSFVTKNLNKVLCELKHFVTTPPMDLRNFSYDFALKS